MVDGTLALDGIKVVELPCFDPMPFLAAAMAGKLRVASTLWSDA